MGKRRRFKHIPFKEPIDDKTYMEFYRSRDPEKLAVEKGIVDKEKLRKLMRLLFTVSLLQIYYIVSFVAIVTYVY